MTSLPRFYDLDRLDAAACEEIALAILPADEAGSEFMPTPGIINQTAPKPEGTETGVACRRGRPVRAEVGPMRAPWLRGPYRRQIPREERWLLRVLVLGAAVVALRIAWGVLS